MVKSDITTIINVLEVNTSNKTVNFEFLISMQLSFVDILLKHIIY